MTAFHDVRIRIDGPHGQGGTATDLDTPGPSLHLTDCTAVQLPGVRRWLRRRLEDPERAIDAELVVTELISNAIDHGAGVRAVRIAIRPPGRLRIEVDDHDPSVLLTVGRSRFGDPRGNGLAIIDAVASWGVDADRNRKTVWADL